MLVMLCGIILGILLFYVLQRVTARRNSDDIVRKNAYKLWEEAGKPEGRADNFWFSAQTKGPSSLTTMLWGIVLIVLCIVAVALIGVALDSYLVATGAVEFRQWVLYSQEVAQTILVPLVAGAAIGILLMSLYAVDTFSSNAALAVTALLGGIILTFFVATEREFGWFTRILKFSIASAELDFAPIKQQQGSPNSGVKSSDQGLVAGPLALEKSLPFIRGIPSTIIIDNDYLTGIATNEVQQNFLSDTVADFKLITAIMLPLVKSIELVHSQNGGSNLTEYIPRETIETVRSLSNLKYDQSSEYRFNNDLKSFKDGILKAWDKVCGYELWYKESGVALDYEEAGIRDKDDSSCSDGKASLARLESIKEYFDEKVDIKKRPLSRDRPYGQILSAWLLVGTGESEAALRDLISWLKTHYEAHQREEDKSAVLSQVYSFRALINISKLYVAKGTNSNDELESLLYFKKAISAGDALVSRPKDVMSEMKKISKASDLGATDECVNLSPDWFKQLYLQYLVEVNNFVDVLGKYPEAIRASRAEEDLRRYADELVSVRAECLFTKATAAAGKYGIEDKAYTIPEDHREDVTPARITEQSTRTYWEAFYDSRAVAYRGLATEVGVADLNGWTNAICESLRAAIEGRKLQSKEGNDISLLSSDLLDEPLSNQRSDISRFQDTTNLDAIAQEDKNLLADEGRDPSCALQTPSNER